MALKTTWGSHNRVIERELTTIYEREIKTIFDPARAGTFYYWLYTRTRAKTYKYIGLTQAAAIDCANALNRLYQRRALAQEWAGERWQFVTNINPVSQQKTYSTSPTAIYSDNVTVCKRCAVAEPSIEKGCAWNVKVSVNEILEYKYMEPGTGPEVRCSPWTSFESNIGAMRNEFTGAINEYNENYDTADVGYGSPT